MLKIKRGRGTLGHARARARVCVSLCMCRISLEAHITDCSKWMPLGGNGKLHVRSRRKLQFSFITLLYNLSVHDVIYYFKFTFKIFSKKNILLIPINHWTIPKCQHFSLTLSTKLSLP